jgi:uncharacterized protein YecE (DUF72 family)
MSVRIGTSGWQYRDWRGAFYPPGLPQHLWLAEYARQFTTVELNYTFYRLPERRQFESWAEQTPEGFVVAVKASRLLTHVRQLRDPEAPVARLLERAAGLGDRLGPILLQLPPRFHRDLDALDACLACFPAPVRVAVELRHRTWWTPQVRRLLADRGAALCWADRRGRPVTPLWRTADWGYVRLHEGAAAPKPRYGRRAIAHWARRVVDTWAPAEDVFVYFNNDAGAAAPHDAAEFTRVVSRTTRESTPDDGPRAGVAGLPRFEGSGGTAQPSR